MFSASESQPTGEVLQEERQVWVPASRLLRSSHVRAVHLLSLPKVLIKERTRTKQTLTQRNNTFAHLYLQVDLGLSAWLATSAGSCSWRLKLNISLIVSVWLRSTRISCCFTLRNLWVELRVESLKAVTFWDLLSVSCTNYFVYVWHVLGSRGGGWGGGFRRNKLEQMQNSALTKDLNRNEMKKLETARRNGKLWVDNPG